MMKRSLVRMSLRTKLDMLRDCCLWLLLVFALLPSLASANIYRCVSESGVIIYSDQPCGQNAEVAFKESKMSVDDAISREIIHMKAARDRLSLFEQDVEDHAKVIGRHILPDQKLNSVHMNKIGKNAYNKDWNWTVILFYGLEGDDREWRVEMIYTGTMKDDKASIRLSMIRTYKNDRLIEPSTMQSIKTLNKIKTGVWKYK